MWDYYYLAGECAGGLSFSLVGSSKSSSINAEQLSGKAMNLYLKAIESMKERVTSSLANYDILAMWCRIIITWRVGL